jgi:hypothetical protein
LNNRSYAELASLFDTDGLVPDGQRFIAIQKACFAKVESLINWDSLHRGKIEVLQFPDAKLFNIPESPLPGQF